MSIQTRIGSSTYMRALKLGWKVRITYKRLGYMVADLVTR